MKCNICKTTSVKDWQYCCDPCFKKEQTGVLVVEKTLYIDEALFRDQMDKWLELQRSGFTECINNARLKTYLADDYQDPSRKVPAVAMRIPSLKTALPGCADLILLQAFKFLKDAHVCGTVNINPQGTPIESSDYSNGWRLRSTIFDKNNKPLFRVYCGL